MNKGVFELTWKILFIVIGCLMVGIVIILIVIGLGNELVDGVLNFFNIWGNKP